LLPETGPDPWQELRRELAVKGGQSSASVISSICRGKAKKKRQNIGLVDLIRHSRKCAWQVPGAFWVCQVLCANGNSQRQRRQNSNNHNNSNNNNNQQQNRQTMSIDVVRLVSMRLHPNQKPKTEP